MMKNSYFIKKKETISASDPKQWGGVSRIMYNNVGVHVDDDVDDHGEG